MNVSWPGVPGPTVRQQGMDVLRHASVLVAVFWLLFALSEVTLDVVVLGTWVYVIALYAYKLSNTAGSSGGRWTLERLGVVWLWWGVLFPLTVLVANLLCLRLLQTVLESPTLRELPVLETIATEWNWLYVSGLSALVVYTAALCAVACVGGLAVRVAGSGLRSA